MYVVKTLVTDSIKDTRLTVLRFLPFLGSQNYIHSTYIPYLPSLKTYINKNWMLRQYEFYFVKCASMFNVKDIA